MKLTQSIFQILLVFSASVSAVADSKNDLKTLQVESQKRRYLPRVPEKCKAEKCPLVLVFHGGMGNPFQIEKHSGFTELSEKESFIVVYPEGLNKQWNDGRKGQNDKVDDMAFVDQLLVELKNKYKIDEKKIYSTGMSNGGLFSFRLACERSEVFAGIAPVAANHSVGVTDKCKPQQPVAVLNIVGTDDKAVPYKGGTISVLLGIRKRGEVWSSDETLRAWVGFNSCSLTASVETIDSILDDKTSIKIEKHYDSCKKPVVRMSVIGGGHAWPGREPAHRGAFHRVVTSKEIDATQEIWKFFKANAKL